MGILGEELQLALFIELPRGKFLKNSRSPGQLDGFIRPPACGNPTAGLWLFLRSVTDEGEASSNISKPDEQDGQLLPPLLAQLPPAILRGPDFTFLLMHPALFSGHSPGPT